MMSGRVVRVKASGQGHLLNPDQRKPAEKADWSGWTGRTGQKIAKTFWREPAAQETQIPPLHNLFLFYPDHPDHPV